MATGEPDLAGKVRLEYDFYLSGKVYEREVVTAGQYFLYGSGMAPAEIAGDSADEPILGVNVHIEPFALKTFLGETFDFTSGGLSHLIRPDERLYYQRYGTTTVAMQTALHQLLNCPFDDVTKKVYFREQSLGADGATARSRAAAARYQTHPASLKIRRH